MKRFVIWERHYDTLRIVTEIQAEDGASALKKFRGRYGGNYGQLYVLPMLFNDEDYHC